MLDESKIADESTDLYRDPDETDDIWNDQSLGLQERITAAATRLANNHRDNKTLRNDAMRAIGGNLSDLRKAMSLQRTFDMTTDKRVADLARVLMSNVFLNRLSQQEVKRLLAAVADEAALEYTGLQLAMEYAENIKDSKVEERKLREEIKQAHDTTSERDRATDSYRQYIASLQEAIRQNKIERVQSYFDLVGRLSDSLRESIANAKDFKEAEKQRIREIQHNANSDMEGKDEHQIVALLI